MIILDDINYSISNHYPFIALSSEQFSKVDNLLIKPLVESFFTKVGIDKYVQLDPRQIISDVDFFECDANGKYAIGIDYFYNNIIGELQKDKSGNIQVITKYSIVFDKNLVYDKVKNIPYNECEINNIKILYGEIKLGEKSILYYLYFNLQVLIDFLKKNI